ncbi:MAG TPA: BamA/TamA family outer membrane protein [Vicinamibacterales bacterium]|nr:BamA/TamA family outer membrane protein [Vicinamibacterales bacterium]
MRALPFFVSIWLGCAVIGIPLVHAQEPQEQPRDTPVEPTDAASMPDRPFHATLDVGDIWHRIRHKDQPLATDEAPQPRPDGRFVVFAPSIGSRPATGLTLGLNGNMAFFRGDSNSTHLSTLSGGFRISQKKQVLSNLRYAVFGLDDVWYFDGDNRANWTSINAYGLGGSSSAGGTANLKFDLLRFYEAVYRRVKPGLFVGGGLNVNNRYNIRAGEPEPNLASSAYVTYTLDHGFPLDHQFSAGANAAVRYDTRDNAINAARGWLAAATYRTFFKGLLGSDATYQQLTIDVRTYKALTRTGSQRLAFWMITDVVTGGVAPFLDLPTTGGDARSGRGYTEGLNRGERLAYGEVEYRGALTPNGLAGFVAFLNTTTIGSSETGAHLFENAEPAAGVGLRLLLNKRSRTNFYTDWGWGTGGSRGFYLGIQEAF